VGPSLAAAASVIASGGGTWREAIAAVQAAGLALEGGRILPQGMTRLHHIGIASSDARHDAEQWARLLGYHPVGEMIHDPVQRVNVLFLARDGEDTLIELVEPASDDAPMTRFLSSPTKMYHLCYEVEDLQAAVDYARHNGALVVQEPVPAVAFQQRRIAWCFSKTGQLVEYLERASIDR
jgi:methylmalonyl-CoA/ethylmalonyl-CoA epimerase